MSTTSIYQAYGYEKGSSNKVSVLIEERSVSLAKASKLIRKYYTLTSTITKKKDSE